MRSQNKKIKQRENRVLVTGANGFIGSYLCDALIKKGYEVIGLVYKDQERIRYLKKNKKIKIVSIDITNFKEVFKIFKKYKPQGVFHTAALIPREENTSPLLLFETNIKGTLNLLEACRLQKVKKFVHSSSMSVYGKNIRYLPIDEKHPLNPIDFYGLSKRQAEELCKFYAEKYDLNVIILRYAGVYGAGRKDGAVANFVERAIKNQSLKIFNNVGWDIVYVEDVVLANLSALRVAKKLGFKVMNIGSGKETKIKNLANKIIEISGSKSNIEFNINQTLSPLRFYYNITRAKKILNFNPRPINKALSRYIREIKRETKLK